MPFCINCGKQFPDNAKFCPKCGTPASHGDLQGQEQRRVTYVGEVRKCPSCGMELPGMAAICPGCGYELNSQSAHPVIAEFASKLNKCDQEIADEEQSNLAKKKRGWSSWGALGKLGWLLLNFYTACIPLVFYRIKQNRPHTPATMKKASIIENFQVPNEKAAIIEMLYLIRAKIDALSTQGANEETLYWIKLWDTKAKYLCDKARMLLSGDKTASDIYGDAKAKAGKIRSSVILKRIAIIAAIPMLCILITLNALLQSSHNTAEPIRSLYTETELRSNQIFSPLMADKPEIDKFDGSTNKAHVVGDISIPVPDYFGDGQKNGSNESFFAETGKSRVMLGMDSTTTDYSSYSEETISSYLDSAMGGFLRPFEESEDFTNMKQLDSKNLSVAGIPCKAVMFSANYKTKTTTHIVYAANLLLWDNGTIISLILLQTDNAEYNYFADFDKIVESITRTNN